MCSHNPKPNWLRFDERPLSGGPSSWGLVANSCHEARVLDFSPSAHPAPMFWQRAAAATEAKAGLPVLVVVELGGGNDGLNTVVPYADDLYAKARPRLRIEPKTVLKLNDRVGLHPSLKDLHKLWEAGDLAVVQGVGYPNPNRSHFRAMEIWHAGDAGPVPDAGWLGRLADIQPSLGPCYIGTEATPLSVRARRFFTPSIASLSDYRIPPGALKTQAAPLLRPMSSPAKFSVG